MVRGTIAQHGGFLGTLKRGLANLATTRGETRFLVVEDIVVLAWRSCLYATKSS
jgi:hypothetical protein